MGKKFIKILVVILLLGGIAGGAYYFTDGFGTKNTSIIGSWQKENEDSNSDFKMVWKFFDNGTVLIGKTDLYCNYEINWDKITINLDPLNSMEDSNLDLTHEYTYKVKGNTLTLKSVDGTTKDLTFKKE